MLKIKTPTTYPISQLFGNPAKMYTDLGYKGHNGIDFGCPTGTPIVACYDGFVEYTGEDGSGGIGVYVIHPELNLRSIYWHFKNYTVKVGDKVKQGDILGISDNTGFSFGAHLHFGLKKIEKRGNVWVIPYDPSGWNGNIDPFDMLDFYNIKGNWKRGTTKGIWVKKIQELLNRKGAKLKIDGLFGKKTEKAIKDFQTKVGLKSDGVVGSKTWAKLLE